MKIKHFTILMLMGILVAVSTVGIAEAIQLQVLIDTGSVYSAYRASDIYDGNNMEGDYNADQWTAINGTIGEIQGYLDQLNGTTGSQFIQSGLGLTSRIVQIGFSDDQIWYGNADNIEITSLQPYINVDSSTSYAAVVQDQTVFSTLPIPNLRDAYTKGDNGLTSAVGDGPFDYSSIKKLIGNVVLTDAVGDVVTVTGDGIAVLKLNDDETKNVKVSGNGIATHVLSNSDYNNLDLVNSEYIRNSYHVVNGVINTTGTVDTNDGLLTTNKSWIDIGTFSNPTPTNTTIIKHGFKIGGTIPDTDQHTNHILTTPIPVGNAGTTWGTASITEYDELTQGRHATAPDTDIINKNHNSHEHGGHAHSHPNDTTYTNDVGGVGGVEIDLAVDCATTNTCYAHGVKGTYEVIPTLTESGLLNNVTAVSVAGIESWARSGVVIANEPALPNSISLDGSIADPTKTTAILDMTYAGSPHNKFYLILGTITTTDGITRNDTSVDAFPVEGGVRLGGSDAVQRGCTGFTFYNDLFWCWNGDNTNIVSSNITSDFLIQSQTNVPIAGPLARIDGGGHIDIGTHAIAMTSYADHIWILFDNNMNVFSFDVNSHVDPDIYFYNIVVPEFTLNISNTNPTGIVSHDDKFWVVDDGDNKVYVYDATSYDRLDDFEFDLVSDNDSPSSIAVYNDMFYIYNLNNSDLYIYDVNGNNNSVGGNNVISGDAVPSTITYSLYNTLPAATLISTQTTGFSGTHNKTADTSFLYVRPVDSTTPLDLTLSGSDSSQTGLSISGLDTDILYQIVVGDNDHILDTGITDSDGIINIPNIDSQHVSGKLLLYTDNKILTYSGDFDTVIFDIKNGKSFKLNTSDEKIYTIHAYVKIPISSGPITISNMTLVNSNNDALELDYLNNVYETSGEIYIPVVPGYQEIRMNVDGTESSLKYANVLGNSGVTIISSATSTIETSEASSDIFNATAIASSTGYIIATSDGEMQAVISETISGFIHITNKYTLVSLDVVREPPVNEPERNDPLTAYVDVYINGVKDGETVQIGINPFPDFQSFANAVSNDVATRGVTYTYPDYTLSATLSTNVNAGDFIEFHIYAKIFGEIDGYEVPVGRILEQSAGESTSTANIKSAYVYADYITE